MPYIEKDFLKEELLGTHSNWDNENSKIKDDLFILTQDSNVIKRGSGYKTFLELEEIVDIDNLNMIETTYSDFIDVTLGNDTLSKIAVFDDTMEINRTDITEDELILEEYDSEYIEFSSVLIPIINGPIRKTYGTSFSLKADSTTSYRDKGGYIETYEWILPDTSTYTGEELIVPIANDPNLIGTNLLYSCQAIDILGNKSEKSYFTVTIADSDYPVVTPSWELITINPVIDSFSWDNDNHEEQASYTLDVTAHDPNGQTLIYQVTCDDIDVIIVQDGIDDNIFHITYPEYDENTNVTFTISVINEEFSAGVEIITKIVSYIQVSPIIDSFNWNNDTHKETRTYDLTIIASDENNQDLTYEVECDDVNVTIVQDGVDDNIFHVTYTEYASDTTVNYTITVTNEDLLTDVETDAKLVTDLNPIIDSFTWNDDDHEEQSTYDLTITAHDIEGQDLTYEVECDDGNVTIVQDGVDDNIFHVTYPDYDEDTTVNYTITVTNEDLRTDVEVDSKLVTYILASGDRGVFVGGNTGGTHPVNTIDYVTISTPGDAIDFGNLTTNRYRLSATSNGINDRGIAGGGRIGTGSTSRIDYVTISTPGNSIDFGDLTDNRYFLAATSNGTNERGIFGGGYSSYSDIIDYITISTPGDAIDFGDLSIAKYGTASTSNATNDRGVFGGGYNSGRFDTIEYVTISTTGNTTDFGDLTLAKRFFAACSNCTNDRGIFGGGYSPDLDVIEYITISTPGDAIDFGDLTVIGGMLGATSNGTNNRGIFGGRHDGTTFDVIDYITISTPGDAIDFGDLSVNRAYLAACSDG